MLNEDRPIKMPNFILSLKNRKSVLRLTDEEAGQLFKLLFNYADDEDFEPDENNYPNSVLMMYDSMIPVIDENREKYIRKVERNRQNGKKGGAPVGNQNAQKTTQNNPTVEKTTQNNPLGVNKTKVNKTKLNKVSCKDTLFSNSTEVSQSGFPDGHPTGKPEYRELRRYARIILGEDDAYFCDDFKNAVENYDDDWSDWQNRMKRFAIKQGKEISDV